MEGENEVNGEWNGRKSFLPSATHFVIGWAHNVTQFDALARNGTTELNDQEISGKLLGPREQKSHKQSHQMGEIEIPEISDKPEKSTEVETKKQVKSVPISTLFLKFSNNKERACLVTGFICSFPLLV